MTKLISSQHHYKREQNRLLLQDTGFKEIGDRKGFHFYKHEFWGRILSLFNRAIKFSYYDVDDQKNKTVYISTVSLQHFKERCYNFLEIPFESSFSPDPLIKLVKENLNKKPIQEIKSFQTENLTDKKLHQQENEDSRKKEPSQNNLQETKAIVEEEIEKNNEIATSEDIDEENTSNDSLYDIPEVEEETEKNNEIATSEDIDEKSTSNDSLYDIPEDEKGKYYFSAEDNRSHPIEEIVSLALKEFQFNRKRVLEEDKEKEYKRDDVRLNFKSSKANTYDSCIYLKIHEKTDVIVSEIIKKIKEQYIVDWARTSNQTTCPFTLEEYHKPYILNLNGKTYSKEAISNAIEQSLYQDQPLRLEDGFVLQPSMIRDISLIPNLSLWKNIPKKIQFSEDRVQIIDFDEREARIHNINGFSEFVKNLSPRTEGIWDYKKLYNYYADARNIPHFLNLNETIENLVIQNITFPPHHPKGGNFTFKNILFENCELKMQCWCGMRLKSSKLVNCTLDMTNRSSIVQQHLRKVKLQNCKIKVNHIQEEEAVGIYQNIKEIPNILNIIFNMVEDINDLENCTLEVLPIPRRRG